MSIEEVVRYFGDSGQLANRPESTGQIWDQFNDARIARHAGERTVDWWGWSWWLRSPGILSDFATIVGLSGDIAVDGIDVDWSDVGVRPLCG